jgi:hypothetical protein
MFRMIKYAGILFVNVINSLAFVKDERSVYCVLGKHLCIILAAFVLQSFMYRINAHGYARLFISSDKT